MDGNYLTQYNKKKIAVKYNNNSPAILGNSLYPSTLKKNIFTSNCHKQIKSELLTRDCIFNELQGNTINLSRYYKDSSMDNSIVILTPELPEANSFLTKTCIMC